MSPTSYLTAPPRKDILQRRSPTATRYKVTCDITPVIWATKCRTSWSGRHLDTYETSPIRPSMQRHEKPETVGPVRNSLFQTTPRRTSICSDWLIGLHSRIGPMSNTNPTVCPGMGVSSPASPSGFVAVLMPR